MSSSSSTNEPPIPKISIKFCKICKEHYIDGSRTHELSAQHIANFYRTEEVSSSTYVPTEEASSSTNNAQANPNNKYCKLCKIYYAEGRKHEFTAPHIANVFRTDKAIVRVESALKNRLDTYFIRNPHPKQLNIIEFLKSIEPLINAKFQQKLRTMDSIKSNMVLYLEYVKNEEDGSERKQMVSFKTSNVTIFRATQLSTVLNSMFESILSECSDFEMKDSGWTLNQIFGLELRINRYYALSNGSSYLPLPITTKAVINVKNKDQKCFMYSMLGKFLPKKHKHKNLTSTYTEEMKKKYDFSCFETYPVSIQDITKFEKLNADKKVSVSVFGLRQWDEDDKSKDIKIFPIKVAEPELEDHTDLLYFSDAEATKFHFCWITNFEKLVGSQISASKNKKFICKKCFSHKYSEEDLQKHKKLCQAISKDSFLARFPDKLYVEFENLKNMIRHNYVAYADFECYLRQLDHDSSEPTYAYQQHIPLSYAYLLVSPDPRFKHHTQPVLYRGEDAHIHFVNEMIKLGEEIAVKSNDKESKIKMSLEDLITHNNATNCKICEKSFSEPNVTKVRDHNHQYVETGQSNYRMALCQKCNLKYFHPKNLVVFFHNLGRYDMKLIVKALNGCKHRVSIIPNTEETYITLSLHISNEFTIKFVDSYRFLSASLDALVRTIPEDSFVFTKKLCKTLELFKMMQRKGVFCYDYVNDPSKLEDTCPPPREAFFNRLTQTGISEEDYEWFCKVWELFGFKNLGEFLDFYQQLDICQLADIFEEFRTFCINCWGLDCANYLTLPSFAFDAALKMTKAKIRLFHDIEMVNMIMSNIRGGITQVSRRFAVANNPYLPTYDKSKPTSYIQNMDATALYAHTMCRPLPYDGYKWVPEEELKTLDVTKIADDAEIGVIVEADIIYPESLHDLHADLPFLCRNEIPPHEASKHRKLITSLRDRKKYVIHYVALKQALENGLILEKIHRAISFRQKPILKPFIELNARLRKEATNSFHQNLLKLASNAIYGKFLESPLKRKDIRLGTNPKQILRYISRVEFKDRTIFDEELVAIHMRRTEIVYDRPMIIGFSVLDLSKVFMYDFHYNHMLKIYPPGSIFLLYMDTDSFIYLIITPDRYVDMLKFPKTYDCSNFSPDHILYSLINKKRMGTFKDETGGRAIAQFVGLSAKMYAYIYDLITEMRAKGVPTHVLKKTANFDLYKRVLFGEESSTKVESCKIESRKHNLYSVKSTKTALTAFDDKRYICSDGFSTLPWGHKDIPKDFQWKEENGSEVEAFQKQVQFKEMDPALGVDAPCCEEHGVAFCQCDPLLENEYTKLIKRAKDRSDRLDPSYLVIGDQYPLDRLERVESTYGERLVAHIEYNHEPVKVFLPLRLSTLSDSTLDNINGGRYDLKCLGPRGRSYNYELCVRETESTPKRRSETEEDHLNRKVPRINDPCCSKSLD